MQAKPVEPGFIINLTIPVESLNVILTSLEAQPYKLVAETINEVRSQAMAQIAAAQSIQKSKE